MELRYTQQKRFTNDANEKMNGEINNMSEKQHPEIPDQVLDLLNSARIGYLSVTSSKGELFTYPVAFFFSDFKVYFMTPVSAAKLKFIRSNPTVSFLVDNHTLTTDSCGAMFQGKARVFSIAKTVLSILSIGPKIAKFASKYPGMFTFYAKGKEIPDERKLYRYRLIRIDPTKIVYWRGYKFDRYFPSELPSISRDDPLSKSSDETKLETIAQLMQSSDEDLTMPTELQQSQEWIDNLHEAAKNGIISTEEHYVIDSYRNFLRTAAATSKLGPTVTEEERKFLNRWKANKSEYSNRE